MWVWDMPSGVFKDHALSSNIRKQAIADVQLLKFLRPEPGFGKGKGQSITITRILKLPIAGRVAETDRLPSGRPLVQTKSVTVSEWGFKIPVTEFEKNLSYFDIMNPFQGALRDQMALTLDKMCADALKLTKTVYTPALAGGSMATAGSAGAASDKNLDVSDLRFIHDYLRQTLICPPFRGGKYIGVLSTRAARGIKNDPEYKDWLAPTTSEPLMSGALKSIEGFDLYESNNADALADLVGNSTTTGGALFFGADPGFLAEVVTPELRAGLPEDLGRFREIGWVGEIEAGLTWETAALSRVINVGST